MIAHKFRYEFSCDAVDCHGHELMCFDWEMGQSYRTWSRKYPAWESAFRQRYERETIEKFDTHFFVGTVHHTSGTNVVLRGSIPYLIA